MPNTGVSGRIVDKSGAPLEGLVASVRRKFSKSNTPEFDAEFGLELGSGTSDQDGLFDVRYGAVNDPHLLLEVELTHPLGRRVAPLRRFSSVTAETVNMGNWVVSATEASGWVATTGAFAPTAGNEIDLLIDNESAWAAVYDAVMGASGPASISFMLFYLDVGYADPKGNTYMKFSIPVTEAPGLPGDRLESALRTAGSRGVTVRILLNDFEGTFICDTAWDVSLAFQGAAGVETRVFHTPQLTPVHAKVMIIRSANTAEAYVIGSPFVQDYFDDPSHRLRNWRRGGSRMRKQVNVPVHDVSLRLRGPAIADLEETFRLHWEKAGGTPHPNPVAAVPALASAQAVTAQVTRSLRGAGFFSSRKQGETSIYEAYLRAIENAESYVYLENQYFTSRELAETLVRAIKRKTGLQVILLTNNKVDIPLYGDAVYMGWHSNNVQRLLTGLTETERKRVGVFTLWTHEKALPVEGVPTAPLKSRIGRIYVHSKVGIVDDEWVTIGSANLDGVSLLLSEHAALLHQAGARSTEANIVVLGAGADGTPTDLPVQLRMRLWAEHLGLTADGDPENNVTRLVVPPVGGWLGLWNERWEAKKASLESDPVTIHPSRVLRWPANKDGMTPDAINSAQSYLKALGFQLKGAETVETFDFYDFRKKKWE